MIFTSFIGNLENQFLILKFNNFSNCNFMYLYKKKKPKTNIFTLSKLKSIYYNL